MAVLALLAVCVTASACAVGRPIMFRPPQPGNPNDGPPAEDPASVSLSILPPGNGNLVGWTTRHLDDQRVVYDRIEDAVARGDLTDRTLGEFFKPAGLGTEPAVRTDHPAQGVTIEWDRFGVPRVRGRSAEEVAWGAGWAVGEARLLVAEIARLLGRAGTIEMGGGDIPTAIARFAELPRINYTDAELEASIEDAVEAAGAEGTRMLAAADSFVDGLNAWIAANTIPREVQELGIGWRPWNRADLFAVAIFIDDVFGTGGGDETGNAALLRVLEERFGPSARAVFDDLRSALVADSATHVPDPFPYPVFSDQNGRNVPAAVDPAAVAIPDEAVPSPPRPVPSMSNYVALGRDRTASGRPLLVGGPQSGYFAPQLLFEMELVGGGYDARGVTVPGLGPWVVIGRGRTYAWTATAGGSDLIDERIELLCEPDGREPTPESRHYWFRGECRPMSRPDQDPQTAWRTVHGPVSRFVTVDGRPAAVSRERASRFRTARAVEAFWKLNRGGVRSAAEFAPTLSMVPMSFNWVYVDDTDVAYFHSGSYPIRAVGVDPDLPSWGTGEWEWNGRLDWRRQPQRILRPDEAALSWNNRIAPGWRAADNQWSYGPVQRVDLLVDRVARLGNTTPAELVAAVQDAATVDLRGDAVLPLLLAELDPDRAPSPELARSVRQLQRWHDSGAHRRDIDGDGWYDDPAVAILDAWFEPLVRAVFGPSLGPALDEPLRRPRSIDNAASLTGGAYASGWYGQLARDLRRVFGNEPVPGGVPRYCGDGDADTCRRLLWSTLATARDATLGLPRLTLLERIRFIPFLTNPESVRWMNRPTFQQVVAFGPRPANTPAGSPAAAAPST